MKVIFKARQSRIWGGSIDVSLEKKGKKIGKCYLSHNSVYFWLTNLVIREKYRRKGYGEYLMRAVQEHTKEQKVPGIILHVLADNHAAIALYEKVGFRRNGEFFSALQYLWTVA